MSSDQSHQPAHRPKISREFIENHRRRRCVEAAAELLHEFGRPGLTSTNIVRLAGTARSSFYEVFTGVEDCLTYAIDLAQTELFASLERQGGEGDWRAEVHEAIDGFYGAVTADPLLAELFLVHSPASRTADGREAAWSGGERFAALLRRGRGEAEARGRPSPPALTDEYVSRAIVSLAARRVLGPRPSDLLAESGSMTSFAVRFYLGSEADDELLGGPLAA